MITTPTGIANRALRKLGARQITSITDTTDKSAIVMNDLYDDTLRYVLSEANWMFATKRVLLTIDETASNKWEKYQDTSIYLVPDDFIRLVGWSSEGAIVRQEGHYFISDVSGLGILYIYYNTTITQWPPFFLEAVVDRLALDASYMLSNSSGNTDSLEERYTVSLRKAKSHDSQGQTPEGIKSDAWVNAKFGSGLISGARKIFYRS